MLSVEARKCIEVPFIVNHVENRQIVWVSYDALKQINMTKSQFIDSFSMLFRLLLVFNNYKSTSAIQKKC